MDNVAVSSEKEQQPKEKDDLVQSVETGLVQPEQREVRDDPILFNFKLTIVTTVLNHLHQEKSSRAYLLKMAACEHRLTDGRTVSFSVKTFERWIRNYRESGMKNSSLEMHARQDKGASRKLTPFVQNRIVQFVQMTPKVDAVTILEQLIDEKLLEKDQVSAETIRRFLKRNDLRTFVTADPRIRHPFIMENVGDMWQADTCYYFKIYWEKATRWVYVQGIMDDHSRYIVSARCYLSDTAVNFRKTLRYAIEHHHIPSMLVVDNGGPYVDAELLALCKRLGIALVHTRANDGTGKGAMERWWKVLQGKTMLKLAIKDPQTLEDVQKIVDDWVNNYHTRINTGVAGTPVNRYMASVARHPVKKPVSAEWLREQFYICSERSVRCTTVQILKRKFRVPDELAHEKKLTVRYDEEDPMNTMHIYFNKKQYPIKEDDPLANSREKRNTGGRKAQLMEKAAAKKDAKKATVEIPEMPVLNDGMTLEEQRAETRYSSRMAGSVMLHPKTETETKSLESNMSLDYSATVEMPLSPETVSEAKMSAASSVNICKMEFDFSLI